MYALLINKLSTFSCIFEVFMHAFMNGGQDLELYIFLDLISFISWEFGILSIFHLY